MTYPTVVQLILKLVLMILVVLVASVPLLVLAGVVLVQNLCPNLRGSQIIPLNPRGIVLTALVLIQILMMMTQIFTIKAKIKARANQKVPQNQQFQGFHENQLENLQRILLPNSELKYVLVLHFFWELFLLLFLRGLQKVSYLLKVG